MDHISLFEQQRPRLQAIAYRMLGSLMDAEDVLQEAYLRWQGAPRDQVESPSAYLTTVVSRLCLDQLRSARVRREQYIGPWLPEPLVTETSGPAERVTLADSLSQAFLVLLETLAPRERAAFLLHEVFDYEYAEIARIIATSEANCRQLVARARRHVRAGRPRFNASPEQQRRLAGEFQQACTRGELDGLVALLSDDVELWVDGGGKVTAARNILRSQSAVARWLLGVIARAPADLVMRPATVNGGAGFVGYVAGQPFLTLTLDLADERIQGIYVVVNPEKLGHVPTLEHQAAP